MKLKVLAISLICLILALSILDAPEYVRCTDIGLCEFLELHGHLDNILKSDIIRHISNIAKNNLFSMLESIINSKDSIIIATIEITKLRTGSVNKIKTILDTSFI